MEDLAAGLRLGVEEMDRTGRPAWTSTSISKDLCPNLSLG
jgi:hypothetical protein